MSKPKLERNILVPALMFKELLTPSEQRMVKQRFVIIELLEEGLSIRQIADRVKVGTDTVVRVSKMLEANPRIRDFLKKDEPSSASKWVFGQVGSEE